jgi:hypothetical protein
VLEEIEERFPAEVAQTARAPFRSSTDVSMLSSLAQHYGLITGRAGVGRAEFAFVNLGASDLPARLRQLLGREHDYVCLGDLHDRGVSPARLNAMLTEFFELYYPVPGARESCRRD